MTRYEELMAAAKKAHTRKRVNEVMCELASAHTFRWVTDDEADEVNKILLKSKHYANCEC